MAQMAGEGGPGLRGPLGSEGTTGSGLVFPLGAESPSVGAGLGQLSGRKPPQEDLPLTWVAASWCAGVEEVVLSTCSSL